LDIATKDTKRQFYERILAPKKTEVEFLCDGAFPLDRNGTIALPKLPRRKLVNMYFKENKVCIQRQHNYFENTAKQFLSTLLELKDEKREPHAKGILRRMCERNLFIKLMKNKD